MHEANQTKLFQAAMRENGKLLVDEPRKGLKAQIPVSEVLSRLRFNTAISCAFVACAKRELKAAIFKPCGKPIRGKNSFKSSIKISF